MEKETQSWFLIKEDWSKWLLQLSDEDAGKFIKAIYTGEIPTGVLGVLYQSHYEEFTRVNQKRIDAKNILSQRGANGAKMRWHKHAIQKDSEDVLKHNQALKTYGGEWATDTGTETVTVTETVIDNKIEYNNKVDQIFNIENLK
jgi:hypothetical protein